MESHRVGHDWSDLAAAAAAVYSEILKKQIFQFFFSRRIFEAKES